MVTYAAPDPASLPPSYHRQEIAQSAISFLAAGGFPSAMVTGGANLMPIHFEGDGRHFAVILNGSPDAARPVVRMSGVAGEPREAAILAPLAEPVKAEVSVIPGGEAVTVISETAVPYLGYLVLEW